MKKIYLPEPVSERITIQSLISSSMSSSVFLVTDKRNGTELIMKKISYGNFQESVLSFFTKSCSSSDIPYLCQPEFFIIEDDAYIFFKKHVPLSEYIKKHGFYLSDILNMSLQISNALIYIYTSGYSHLDVRPENILYDPESHSFMLCDLLFTKSVKRSLIPSVFQDIISPDIEFSQLLKMMISISEYSVSHTKYSSSCAEHAASNEGHSAPYAEQTASHAGYSVPYTGRAASHSELASLHTEYARFNITASPSNENLSNLLTRAFRIFTSYMDEVNKRITLHKLSEDLSHINKFSRDISHLQKEFILKISKRSFSNSFSSYNHNINSKESDLLLEIPDPDILFTGPTENTKNFITGVVELKSSEKTARDRRSSKKPFYRYMLIWILLIIIGVSALFIIKKRKYNARSLSASTESYSENSSMDSNNHKNISEHTNISETNIPADQALTGESEGTSDNINYNEKAANKPAKGDPSDYESDDLKNNIHELILSKKNINDETLFLPFSPLYIKDSDSFDPDSDKISILTASSCGLKYIKLYNDSYDEQIQKYNTSVDFDPAASSEELSSIKELYLNDNNIHDISSISDLTGLETLVISDNDITDLTPLVSCTTLNFLDISGNPVHNAVPLKKMKSLDTLNITDCRIKKRMIKKLIKKLPECRIYY